MSLFQRPKPSQTPRRSRIQPEAKPAFISYHASRKSFDEPAQKVNRPDVIRLGANEPTHKQKILAVCAAIAVIIVAYAVTSLGSGSILVITNPSGVKALRPSQSYQQSVDDILGASILNKNKITIDTNKLSSRIRERFPELDAANIVLPMFGGKPTVELVTARPALLLSSRSNVYVVSSTGKVMISTKDANGVGGLAIPTVNEEADLNIQTGKGVLSKQDVTFITTLVQQFAYQKIKVTSLTLPPLASELRVGIEGQAYYVKFSLLTDPNVVTGQYFVLRNKLAKDHVTPGEYVDSRIEEKIYYR